MSAKLQVRVPIGALSRRRWLAGVLSVSGAALAGCSSSNFFNSGFFSSKPPAQTAPAAPAAPAATPGTTIGTGQVRVGLILPLSATGNAGVAGQAMRNAAQLALSEFNQPNVQLLVEDDAGTPQGAQAAAQQALNGGAEVLLGPLFAQSVRAVGGLARARNVPVIAFSTDTSVAAPGVYLLSFLPESDVARIVQYTISMRRRAFAALIPENAYGSVVEAAFRQDVARQGGKIVALEHYGRGNAAMAGPVRAIARSAHRADALLIADGGDAAPQLAQMLVAHRLNTRRVQLLGTGLWDDPRIYAAPALNGGWYAAPDAAGYRKFSTRYGARFGQAPVRTATLAYDAVALVAALVKTQPNPQLRFSAQVLTNPSGFTGIDGLFRFRADGTNQRGLAVLRVTPQGPQTIATAPRSFAASGI